MTLLFLNMLNLLSGGREREYKVKWNILPYLPPTQPFPQIFVSSKFSYGVLFCFRMKTNFKLVKFPVKWKFWLPPCTNIYLSQMLNRALEIPGALKCRKRAVVYAGSCPLLVLSHSESSLPNKREGSDQHHAALLAFNWWGEGMKECCVCLRADFWVLCSAEAMCAGHNWCFY